MSLDFFYNNWLDYNSFIDPSKEIELTINLDTSFFTDLKFDQDSLRSYAIDAAKLCAEPCGDNIALCLSGGLDSQFMISAFKEANIKFTTYIFKFCKDLNTQDTDHAELFCKQNQIDYKIVPFDVITFLNRENYDVGIRYNSASPHFNVHYSMFNMLRAIGHSGVVCGGIYPFITNGIWGNNLSNNAFNFINYCMKENFYVQGSFLSYYPKLAWALGILTSDLKLDYTSPLHDLQELNAVRETQYEHKIDAFNKFQFNLIPQESKFTGFEKVKIYYEKLTGDGWFFENEFRTPLEKIFLKKIKDNRVLHLTRAQAEILSQIKQNYILSC